MTVQAFRPTAPPCDLQVRVILPTYTPAQRDAYREGFAWVIDHASDDQKRILDEACSSIREFCRPSEEDAAPLLRWCPDECGTGERLCAFAMGAMDAAGFFEGAKEFEAEQAISG
ncbi:MAG: hypothetical protein NXI14_08955 [bacterium]|nr:hypothetical protein [bacterium]